VRVECAILCDAALMREGLITVIGGGITGTTLREFPGRLQITFAYRAVLESRELRNTHVLKLSLVDARNGFRSSAEVIFTRGTDPAYEEAALSAPVPLDIFEVPQPGTYLLEASLDNHAFGTYPLRVATVT